MRGLGAGGKTKSVKRRRVRVHFEHVNKRIEAFVKEQVEIRDNDIITPAEIAKLLGYTERTIREWARQKKIPAHKTPSGRVYFLRSDFLDKEFAAELNSYTVKTLAKKLDKSEATILRWIHAGKLSAYQIGKKWQVTQEDLQDFLDGGWQKDE